MAINFSLGSNHPKCFSRNYFINRRKTLNSFCQLHHHLDKPLLPNFNCTISTVQWNYEAVYCIATFQWNRIAMITYDSYSLDSFRRLSYLNDTNLYFRNLEMRSKIISSVTQYAWQESMAMAKYFLNVIWKLWKLSKVI